MVISFGGIYEYSGDSAPPVCRVVSGIGSEYMAISRGCAGRAAPAACAMRSREMGETRGLRGERCEVDPSAAFRTNERRRIGARAVASRKGTYDRTAARGATRRPRVVRSLRPTGGDGAWCEWTLRPPVVEWTTGLGTKCVVHRVGTDFARRGETRQPLASSIWMT